MRYRMNFEHEGKFDYFRYISSRMKCCPSILSQRNGSRFSFGGGRFRSFKIQVDNVTPNVARDKGIIHKGKFVLVSFFFFFFFRTRFSIRPVDRELKHLRAIIIRRNDETRRKGNENFAHKSYALGGALNGCIKGGWRKKVCCAKFA